MKANRYCVLTACQTVSPDVAWSRNLCWVLTVYRVEGVNRVGTALRLQPVVTPWGYVILEPPPPRPQERPLDKNAREQVAKVGCEHGC